MSKGIGDVWLDGNITPYRNGDLHKVALEDGTLIPIPRYYIKKIFTDDERRIRAEYISDQIALKRDKVIKEAREFGITEAILAEREMNAKIANRDMQNYLNKTYRT